MQDNTVTVDAPITCAIEKRWGGGEIVKYEDPGRIERVGIENLRAISEFDPGVRTREYGNMDRANYVAEEYYADENHYSNFVTFDNLKNGWVRNATALHFVTAWWARSPAPSGSPCRIACRGSRFPSGAAAAGSLRAARTAGAGAALPVRQGPAFVHDGAAHGERQRVPRLQGHQPVSPRASRTSSGPTAASTTTSRRR